MSEEKATYTVDTNIDIPKLIDEAIEKKDRRVTIFVSNIATTIKVEPIVDDDPRWIVRDTKAPFINTFICSECGRYSDRTYNYCPECGEKMKVPDYEH